MKNIAIFASGNGSNFEVLAKADLNCNVAVLICNKSDAYAITRAKNLGIDYYVVSSEKEILEIIEKYKIDLLVLAGYLKIFSSEFVSKFEERIINIHPSKLPKYRGLNAIKRAYESGDSEIGVSIHYVDSGVDTGRVIACECIRVNSGETLEEVEAKVHKKEHDLYPRVLEEIL